MGAGMKELVRRQREAFERDGADGLEARLDRLERLAACVEEGDDDLLDALEDDLGKDRYEAYGGEIGFVLGEIAHARKHLKRWMKERRAKVPPLAWPAKARVRREAYGVSLVLGPWNYPFQLAISPVVASIAAGNRVVVKMSEHAPRTAETTQRLIARRFRTDELAVILGGPEVAQELLEQRFDHIFFTGGTEIGRKVMTAAARHLTPVVLELGGKCPAIVDSGDANALETMARRLVWGKFMNSGQTCVAPDHVWVREELRAPLVEAMKRAIDEFYPNGRLRIVNERHFERLRGYLDAGRIEHGGAVDPARLEIAPTLLADVPLESAPMREEIFGPILPVVTYDDLEKPLDWMKGAGSPLAVYLFTDDAKAAAVIERRCRAGGVSVNDVIVHITGPDLPFGGVGESGMGRYHGEAGFDAFTWEKVVLKRRTWPEFEFRYPSKKIDFDRFKRLMRWAARH